MNQPLTPPSDSKRPFEPHRGARFGWLALGLCMLLGAAIATAAMLFVPHSNRHDQQPQVAEHARYQCPMHPQIVRDEPGVCPICGMTLVRLAAGGARDGTATERRVGGSASGGPPDAPGLATVDIDPARQQLIGLTTAKVTRGNVAGSWRTSGRVAIDETSVRHINVKVPGYVEHVYVDFIGKKVRKGDPLFSIYSPELLSAQQEYLLALRTKGALNASGALSRDGDALVEAARTKLALWDIPRQEIGRIEKTGELSKTLTFRSPAAGVVTKKDVVEGMNLAAGAMPYEIVDLSTVWVLADVYESELRFLKTGMHASLRLTAFPNQTFEGKVLFVDPLLDPKTRTVKVRLAFDNPHGDLRPEMFGEVVLHGRGRDALRIPADAIIDSGAEQVVFVALGAGKFQPRAVRVGATSDTLVEVVSGLSQGDEVVTRANFLVDSESRLRASLFSVPHGASANGEAREAVASAPADGEAHAIVADVPANSERHATVPSHPASTQTRTDARGTRTGGQARAVVASMPSAARSTPADSQVQGAAASAPSAQRVALNVTSRGFSPAEAHVRAGEPVTLVVTRHTDDTCVTEIVLKTLGIARPLPLHRAVEITFTPTEPGRIEFSCGMGMFSGALLVK